MEQLFDASLEVAQADLEACHRFDVESRLGELSLPVSLVTGKDDAMTPPRLARRLASRVNGAALHVVDRTGHMLPQEQPELTRATVAQVTVMTEGSHA